MDIHQLEAFVNTVRYKSFSEAANRLYLSQPTVSSHIRSLESELGTKLINRTTKGFEITESGKKLYDYAERIISLRDKAVTELISDKDRTLHVGSSSVAGGSDLPEYLSEFQRSHPDITLRVTISDSKDIVEKVSDGIVEAGIVGSKIRSSDCVFIPIGTDELVIVTPATSYYSELLESAPPVERIFGEPFIIREDASGTRLETEYLLSRSGYALKDMDIRASVNNNNCLCRMVSRGMGISVISKKLAQSAKAVSDILIYPISDSEHSASRSIYAVYNKKRGLKQAAKDFIDIVVKDREAVDL